MNEAVPYVKKPRRRLTPRTVLNTEYVEITDCIEWGGKKNLGRGGYGWFMGGNKIVYAHLASFFVTRGFWPEVCRHACDNPPCVNPNHLLDGTHQDNMRDIAVRNWEERYTEDERQQFPFVPIVYANGPIPEFDVTTAKVLGRVEIADLLKVDTRTPHAWAARKLLPVPDHAAVNGGPAWDRATMINWAAKTGRLPESLFAEAKALEVGDITTGKRGGRESKRLHGSGTNA